MSGVVRTHRDLLAWQHAMELGVRVCVAVRSLPKEERFALAAQMRRSAVSTPSNIAEGFGRGSRQDYIRFLKIARGSLFELDTQLRMASRLGYLDESTLNDLETRWGDAERLLAGLIRSLDSPRPPR